MTKYLEGINKKRLPDINTLAALRFEFSIDS
jgi:hypothetical protein